MGALLGALVGSDVGTSEGSPVGARDGSFVGALDGALLGCRLGCMVGEKVGTVVGEGVGVADVVLTPPPTKRPSRRSTGWTPCKIRPWSGILSTAKFPRCRPPLFVMLTSKIPVLGPLVAVTGRRIFTVKISAGGLHRNDFRIWLASTTLYKPNYPPVGVLLVYLSTRF